MREITNPQDFTSTTDCCSCDPVCGHYGDCCPDFRQECPQEYSIFQQDDGTNKAVCFDAGNPSDPYDRTSYVFISWCHPSGNWCETTSYIDVDYVVQFGGPVVDTETGVFYASIACATCNEIPVSRLITHNVTVFCDFYGYYDSTPCTDDMASPAPSSHQEPSHVLTDVRNTAQCAVALSFPAAGRLCQPYIYTCPDSCENQNLRNLCLYGGLLHIYNTYLEEGYYRNIYCAVCNEGYHNNFSHGFYYPDADLGLPPPDSFSITLLFDMTNNNALQLGSLNVQCRFDEQLLPAGLACGDVICASGYVLTGGDCVKDDESYEVVVQQHHDVYVMSVNACNISDSVTPASIHHMVINGLSGVLLAEVNILYHNTSVNVEVSCNGTLAYSIDVITTIVVNAVPGDLSGILQGAVASLISSIINTSGNDSNVLSVTVSSGNISVAIKPVSNTTDMMCSKYILVESEFEIINGSLKLAVMEGTFDSGFITLPNNSILLCENMTEVQESNGMSAAVVYGSIVLSAISLLCLGIRLVLQVFYKSFQNAPGKMQCNLAVALFFSYALFLTGPFATNASNVCSVLGASKYCSYLASFAWMTCIAGDTWWTLRPTSFHLKDPTDSSTWTFAVCMEPSYSYCSNRHFSGLHRSPIEIPTWFLVKQLAGSRSGLHVFSISSYQLLVE